MRADKWVRVSWILLLLSAFASTPAAAQVTSQAASSLEDSIHNLAVQMADSMASGSVRKLAIVEFSDLNGYRSTLGPFIAEELTTQLMVVKPGSFDIVERQQLAKVLAEQKLAATALLDAESIAKVGKILGIQAIVTGSIADLGEEIKINARSISVETARVFAAGSTKCPKKGVVETLMRQGSAPAPAGAESDTRPGGRQVQPSDVFFQNDFLRLTVDSMALSKKGARATLALRLENLTATDIFLAVHRPMQHCRTGLTDNRGNRFEPGFYDEGAIGIICLRMDSETSTKFSTQISPKGRSTLIFPFQLEEAGEGPGDVFAFSAEFLRFEGGKVSKFSVGISNIALPK